MYAEGDPAGTHRYWDGSAWQGEPVAAPEPVPAPRVVPPPTFAPPPSVPPPPSTGGPGYGGSILAAPAKKSKWKLVVGLIIGLMVLIGACTVFVVRLASGPIDVSNEFLNAVQAGDFEQAWALSDASCFNEARGQEQLEEVFAGQTIESYDLTSTNVQSDNGRSTGSASGTITLSGGDVRRITLTASKPSSDWRVCGFDIGS